MPSRKKTGTQAQAHPPRVFISYSWDTPDHKNWVLQLANELRANGVDVLLDQYDLLGGANMICFMENAIRDSNKVLIIFTPNYKLKSEKRKGGVGFEYSVLNAELYSNIANNTKFIPILRRGSQQEAIPSFMQQFVSINMTSETNEETVIELLHAIYDRSTVEKPPIGPTPVFYKKNISAIPNKQKASATKTSNRKFTQYVRFLFIEECLERFFHTTYYSKGLLKVFSAFLADLDNTIQLVELKDCYSTLRQFISEASTTEVKRWDRSSTIFYSDYENTSNAHYEFKRWLQQKDLQTFYVIKKLLKNDLELLPYLGFRDSKEFSEFTTPSFSTYKLQLTDIEKNLLLSLSKSGHVQAPDTDGYLEFRNSLSISGLATIDPDGRLFITQLGKDLLPGLVS
jgi:hypothetical protein